MKSVLFFCVSYALASECDQDWKTLLSSPAIVQEMEVLRQRAHENIETAFTQTIDCVVVSNKNTLPSVGKACTINGKRGVCCSVDFTYCTFDPPCYSCGGWLSNLIYYATTNITVQASQLSIRGYFRETNTVITTAPFISGLDWQQMVTNGVSLSFIPESCAFDQEWLENTLKNSTMDCKNAAIDKTTCTPNHWGGWYNLTAPPGTDAKCRTDSISDE